VCLRARGSKAFYSIARKKSWLTHSSRRLRKLANIVLRAAASTSTHALGVEAKELAHSDKQSAVADAVAEWADGDALAAHYGHAHDAFCSLDRGRQAGSRSILHLSRRSWLAREFGIRVDSPIELAERLP